MKRCLAALALAVLLCLPLTACQKQQNLYSATWFDLFDTVAIVQGYAAGQDEWNAQAAAVQEDLSRYNELFDIYNHYDDVVNLYDVNAGAAAAPVAVDDELYAFLRWCKDTVYPATDGATNIAAGAVLRLWHDARESDSPAPPDAEAIAAALEHIDIENLVLDDDAQTVYFADPAMTLDVGAVGKGYAVEQTAKRPQARGLTKRSAEHRRQRPRHRHQAWRQAVDGRALKTHGVTTRRTSRLWSWPTATAWSSAATTSAILSTAACGTRI